MTGVKATRVDDIATARDVPGAYEVCRAHDDVEKVGGLSFICPCGCGTEGWLSVNGYGRPGPDWQFDGNVDAPTLKPSVFNSGLPCRWHGYLTNGVWTSC